MMMNRAIDEFHLLAMEEASTAVADNELQILRSPPCTTRQSKILSDSKSQSNTVVAVVVVVAHPVATAAKDRYRKFGI